MKKTNDIPNSSVVRLMLVSCAKLRSIVINRMMIAWAIPWAGRSGGSRKDVCGTRAPVRARGDEEREKTVAHTYNDDALETTDRTIRERSSHLSIQHSYYLYSTRGHG